MDTVHECDRQTDGRTDGQTDRITITDTVQRIASHGKNEPVSDHVAKFRGDRWRELGHHALKKKKIITSKI